MFTFKDVFGELMLRPNEIESTWCFFANERGTFSVARVYYDSEADDKLDAGATIWEFGTEETAAWLVTRHNESVIRMCGAMSSQQTLAAIVSWQAREK